MVANLELPVEDTVYADTVRMKVLVSEEDYERAERELTEASSGQAKLDFGKKEIYFAKTEKDVLVFEE